MWCVGIWHRRRRGKDVLKRMPDEKTARMYADAVFKRLSRGKPEIYPNWRDGGSFFDGYENVSVRVHEIKVGHGLPRL